MSYTVIYKDCLHAVLLFILICLQHLWPQTCPYEFSWTDSGPLVYHRINSRTDNRWLYQVLNSWRKTEWYQCVSTFLRVFDRLRSDVFRAGCAVSPAPAHRSSGLWDPARRLSESPGNYRESHFKCHCAGVPCSGPSWGDGLHSSCKNSLQFTYFHLVFVHLLLKFDLLCAGAAFHCRGRCCSLRSAEISQEFPPSHYVHHTEEHTGGHPLCPECELPLWWRNVCSRKEHHHWGNTGYQSEQQAGKLWGGEAETGRGLSSSTGIYLCF